MPLNQHSRGDIPVDSIKEFLTKNHKTFEEEMSDIFHNFDYDKKDSLSKHKLKVLATELLGLEITDSEAADMVKMFSESTEDLVTEKEFIAIQKMEVDV